MTNLSDLFVPAMESHPLHKAALLKAPPPSRFLSSAPRSCLATSLLPSPRFTWNKRCSSVTPSANLQTLFPTFNPLHLSALSHSQTLHGFHFQNKQTDPESIPYFLVFNISVEVLTSRSNYQRKRQKHQTKAKKPTDWGFLRGNVFKLQITFFPLKSQIMS